MKNTQKNKIVTFIVLAITLVLAGVAIFTAYKLYSLRQQPVAPNVPSSKPRAIECDGTSVSTQSACTQTGAIEFCGTTKYCCPSTGANWTTDLMQCETEVKPVEEATKSSGPNIETPQPILITETAIPIPTSSASCPLPAVHTTTATSSGNNELSLVIQGFPGGCPWSQCDNLSKKIDCPRARKYSEGTFTIPTNCTPKTLTITSDSFLYDDYFYLVIDNKVFATHDFVADDGTLGGTWSWSAITDGSECSPETDAAKKRTINCYSATSCIIPKSDSTGKVNIVLSESDVAKTLSTSSNTHSIQSIVGGEKNDTDCEMKGNLNVKITYSCGTSITSPTPTPIACSRVSFSLTTSTASPSPTPTATATATATPTTTATATAIPTATPSGAPNSCGGTCGSNYNCGSELFCYNGYCRNASCPAETDCTCSNATSTPTSITSTTTTTTTTTVSATATPEPTLPQSGTDWPTVMGIGIGILTLLGSLLLAI